MREKQRNARKGVQCVTAADGFGVAITTTTNDDDYDDDDCYGLISAQRKHWPRVSRSHETNDDIVLQESKLIMDCLSVCGFGLFMFSSHQAAYTTTYRCSLSVSVQ